jgi:hypothetical protein
MRIPRSFQRLLTSETTISPSPDKISCAETVRRAARSASLRFYHLDATDQRLERRTALVLHQPSESAGDLYADGAYSFTPSAVLLRM